MGSSTLLLFNWKKGAPKIEKKTSQSNNIHWEESIYAKKLSKGGGKVGFSKNPKIGKLDIFKGRYKCYTFSETSGQAQKGGEERKIKKGQEN